MRRLKDAVLKIDEDWFMYYIGKPDYEVGDKLDIYDPIKEYDTLNQWLISELEHELELYEDKEPMGSLVNKDNVRKVRRVIDNYYNNKYIEE